MQRKIGKNSTRAANANERKFMALVAEMPCCGCGNPGPSIVDHMYGSTFKHNKVLIGHFAALPYCHSCDQIKTIQGRAAHDENFGVTQADLWLRMIRRSDTMAALVPDSVFYAIKDWGR